MLVFVSRAIKGSCLAATRFWETNTTQGVEIFYQIRGLDLVDALRTRKYLCSLKWEQTAYWLL
ncbi:hypothetical protein A9P82_11280 [Arachidicoccus ginsenosidimutans]|jgi:hypothetical protein|nr:hypothetical protein A9P82_11280 [Arachidicoccus sp. BS20]